MIREPIHGIEGKKGVRVIQINIIGGMIERKLTRFFNDFSANYLQISFVARFYGEVSYLWNEVARSIF